MRRSLTTLLVAGLLACRGSDPQPLRYLGGDDFYAWNVDPSLAGGGATGFFAYTRPGAGNGFALRVLRHDAADADALAHVGDVALGSGTSRLFMSGDTIAIVKSGGVTLVDAADDALPVTELSFSAASPERAAADDRWVLVSSGATLTLVDRAAPSTRTTVNAPANVTALLATQGTFLAFTKIGYVHVVPGAAPTFDAVTDPSVRAFQAAFADGAEAMVAGPAMALGRSRVARLDLSVPAAPVLLRSHEVEGTFGSFAWDGRDTSVVGIIDDADPYSEAYPMIQDGWVVHEAGGAFSSVGTPLPPWRPGPTIAAHAGRLFALSGDGFGFYELMR